MIHWAMWKNLEFLFESLKNQISYFKQKINNINDTFLTDAPVGNDAGTVEVSNRGLFIAVACVAAVAIVAVVISASYVVLKKKEEK